jgi:tetratricopeptide (TPR) repeat protein
MARSFAPNAAPAVRPSGPDQGAASPVEVIRRVSSGDVLLDDYRPLPLSLEWRLAELYWISEGVRPFIADEVPFGANNDGLASTAAAATLFANCAEAAATERDPIHLMEVGAGTALFARYFLDEFRDMCRSHGRDFYDRLVFHVTDRSPQSVRHWNACGIFDDHAAHVRTAVCDAEAPGLAIDRPLRAVFANYVLDSLPAAVLQRTGDTWQQLCARATVREEALDTMGWGHRAEAFQQAARANRIDDLAELLPLLPLLDVEMTFLSLTSDDATAWERDLPIATAATAGDGSIVVHNHGAFRCVDRLLPQLDATGFILLRDYGYTAHNEPDRKAVAQRFGCATAVGVDFVRLERHLRARGADVLGVEGESLLHTRLVTVGPGTETKRTFVEEFGALTAETWTLPARARECLEQELFAEALGLYRQGIERAPRDWRLIGEAARFVTTTLRDAAAGLQLARAAIQLNPWYSPFLWNVLGDCLAALDRQDEAHEAYAKAREIRPADVEAQLRLARTWLRRGDPVRCLEAIGQGLAADDNDMHRHQLLESQQAAIDALSRRRIARRAAAFRRQARLDRQESKVRS